jgi:hypothetical protein
VPIKATWSEYIIQRQKQQNISSIENRKKNRKIIFVRICEAPESG